MCIITCTRPVLSDKRSAHVYLSRRILVMQWFGQLSVVSVKNRCLSDNSSCFRDKTETLIGWLWYRWMSFIKKRSASDRLATQCPMVRASTSPGPLLHCRLQANPSLFSFHKSEPCSTAEPELAASHSCEGPSLLGLLSISISPLGQCALVMKGSCKAQKHAFAL